MSGREGAPGPARPGDRGPGRGGRTPRTPYRFSRRAGRAYQGVVEAVLAIPTGMALGYGVDYLLGFGPAGILVGLALGFAAFALRLNRLRVVLDAETQREAEASADHEGSGESEGSSGRWERR